MLPDTVTVNTGSPATDKVFSGVQRDGNSVSFSKDSPQGDLQGAWTLSFAAERTSKGLVRSLAKLRVPLWNATAGRYEGEIVVNLTAVRPELAPKQSTKDAIEGLAEAVLQPAILGAIVDARH